MKKKDTALANKVADVLEGKNQWSPILAEITVPPGTIIHAITLELTDNYGKTNFQTVSFNPHILLKTSNRLQISEKP